MIRRGWIATGAMIAVLCAPNLTPVAMAGGGDGSSNSAAQQYVEAVPTASGGGPSSGAKAGSSKPAPPATKSRPVTRAVQKSITRKGGSDAAALRRVATSPALGAPQTPAPTKAPPSGPSRSASGPNESGGQSAFAAALSVDHGIPVAFVILALVVLAAAYVVGRRGHPSRSSV